MRGWYATGVVGGINVNTELDQSTMQTPVLIVIVKR